MNMGNSGLLRGTRSQPPWSSVGCPAFDANSSQRAWDELVQLVADGGWTDGDVVGPSRRRG